MNKERIKELKERINEPEVLERVADKRVLMLKESFLEWLEKEKEPILKVDRDKLLQEIKHIAFPEVIEVKDEVRDVLNEAVDRVEPWVREALEEMINLVRKRLEPLTLKSLIGVKKIF